MDAEAGVEFRVLAGIIGFSMTDKVEHSRAPPGFVCIGMRTGKRETKIK